MIFKIKESVIKNMDNFTYDDSRGKVGFLGRNKDNIIEYAYFPRVTGGCNDMPSISRKNMSLVIMEMLKHDMEICGMVRHFTNEGLHCRSMDYNTDARLVKKEFVPKYMNAVAVDNMINSFSYPLLFLYKALKVNSFYLGTKDYSGFMENKRIYKGRIPPEYYHNLLDSSSVNKIDGLIVIEFKERPVEVVSNVVKYGETVSGIVKSGFIMTNEEIINAHSGNI